MKKIIAVFVIILLAKQGNAQVEQVEFQAAGLTCSMCSNAINKAMKNLPFIEKVNTDLNKNLFTLTIKKGEKADLDAITKKVEGAGFSIAKFWMTINLSEVNVSNDQHIVQDGMNFHFMHVQPAVIKGLTRLQVIDQHYVLAKEYKKFSHDTKMSCYQTGTMAACCPSVNGKLAGSGRIYHVTI